MIPPHLDFKILKQTVTIERVLAIRGLDRHLRRRRDRLVGPCPLHGGDNPNAFVVSLSRNLWYCFTRCDAGGDVIELVRRLDRSNYREVADYLASLAGLSPVPPKVPPPVQHRTFVPFVKRLHLDPEAPLLRRKGIRPATSRRFEAGAYHYAGFLAGCVAVRLHDHLGRPLGYAGRRLDPDQARRYGKWKLPSGLPKSQILYNFHRVRQALGKGLVVVECPWGVMRLSQIEAPAVALLGTHLSTAQRDLLCLTPRVILMLDGDRAGRKAARRIEQELSRHVEVRAIKLPNDLDPDDLFDDELIALIAPLLS